MSKADLMSDCAVVAATARLEKATTEAEADAILYNLNMVLAGFPEKSIAISTVVSQYSGLSDRDAQRAVDRMKRKADKASRAFDVKHADRAATPDIVADAIERVTRLEKSSEALTPAIFYGAVAAALASFGVERPILEDIVAAAEMVTFPCRRCCGTGAFVIGMENGKPKIGNGGPCYRCAGKGVQDHADVARNLAFDRYNTARAMSADLR